jgi:hypothetical protein
VGNARTAFAQATGESAIAQALFEQARVLMTDGHYEEACSKLAESQRLERASGTLLNLALCHEKVGKTATAWSEYNDVVAAARLEGNDERQRIATDRTRELEPRLCHLTLVSSPEVAALGNVTIRMDGVTLGLAAWGMPIPVDPGNHEVEVTVPGRKTWSQHVSLQRDGESSSLSVVAPQEEPLKSPAPSDADTRPGTDARKRIALAIGGGSILVLGAGTTFGLLAKSSWDERNGHCPADVCDDQAVSAAKRARVFALAADGAFSVGVVGIGLATYLALTSSKGTTSIAPFGISVASDRVQLAYGGHF